MDINVTAICVTIIIGIIAIALSIYLGLRSFTNNISKQVEETKSSVVLELSGIKESVIKIITRVDDVWQLASVFMSGKGVGTVEIELIISESRHYLIRHLFTNTSISSSV